MAYTYIVFINRIAEKLYDFVRLVLYFESLSKPDSIRIGIHNSPSDHVLRTNENRELPQNAPLILMTTLFLSFKIFPQLK